MGDSSAGRWSVGLVMVRSVIGGRRRVLVSMVSMVVLLSAMAVGGVEGGSAGPGGVAAAGSFDDDDGWVHEPSIDALAREGILDGTGCGEKLFCPDHPVLRWVMAVWLVRALGEAEPGAAKGVSFSDVDGEVWWSPFVERLAGLGVTRGCSADPSAVLSRGCGDSGADGDLPGPNPRTRTGPAGRVPRHRGQRSPRKYRLLGGCEHHRGLRHRSTPLLPRCARDAGPDGDLPGYGPST